MARSAIDYGIPGLSDATLQTLAGNVKRYGEKGRYASQELAQRQGVMGDANSYRAALERAAYQDAGSQYGAGLGQISGYLARSGPLADSGAATALRARLASQTYGAAAGRVGSGYADYLGQAMKDRQAFNYQRQLMAYQKRLGKKSPWSSILGAVGGIGGALIGGPPGAAIGSSVGSAVGGGIGGGGGSAPMGPFTAPPVGY